MRPFLRLARHALTVALLAACLDLAGAAGHGAACAVTADQDHRRRAGRRPRRSCRPHHGAAAQRERTPGDRREPARRQRDHRHRCGREIARRRLHPGDGQPHHAGDPAAHDQGRLRPRQGLAADHPDVGGAERPRRQDGVAGALGGGAHRLRQGQPPDQCNTGPRRKWASDRRAVQAAHRNRPHARALPRRRAGAAGRRRRACRHDVRRGGAHARARRGRPRARARGVVAAAQPGAARCPDRGGGRLRGAGGRRLVRAPGTRRHAACGRRLAQRRGPQGVRRAGGARAPGQARTAAAARDAGGVCGV